MLYNALQHAREWLAGETCKPDHALFPRQLRAEHGSRAEVTQIVDQNELWFVCIANPDGYE